jgi:hypothetical protein
MHLGSHTQETMLVPLEHHKVSCEPCVIIVETITSGGLKWHNFHTVFLENRPSSYNVEFGAPTHKQ